MYQVDEDEDLEQNYNASSFGRDSELLEEEEVEETSEVCYEDTEANHGEVPVSFESRSRCCHSIFPSRNKLHQQLQLSNCEAYSVIYKTDSHIAEPGLPMILSTAPTKSDPGLGFRKWHYMEVSIQLSLEGAVQTVCLNTSCTMSLVDRRFLKSLFPSVDLMTQGIYYRS